MQSIRTLGTAESKHLYEVEIKTDFAPPNHRSQIDVYANTRTQAESLARKNGFEVCSVNMVG
jgi:hypothetical protein